MQTQPDALDAFLIATLEEDFLALVLAPARLPSEARETVRPVSS